MGQVRTINCSSRGNRRPHPLPIQVVAGSVRRDIRGTYALSRLILLYPCQATVENVPICDTKSVPPVLVDNPSMPPVIVSARIAPTLSSRPPAAPPQELHAQGMGRETIACTEASRAPIPGSVVLVTAISLPTPPLSGPGRPYPGAGRSGL